MKKIGLIVFSTILFFACRSTDRKEDILKPEDTTKIISSILNGREFLKDKLFNESWLKIKSRFKVSFLEDNSRTKMLNIGPGFHTMAGKG